MEGKRIACDLVCMGVGSPKAWRGFKAWLEKKAGSPLASYRHRPKTLSGASAANPPELAVLADGRELQGTCEVRQWRRLYGGRWALRPSCHGCAYHSVRRAGDATIGDFWGIEATELAGFRDDLGVSLVLASTRRGEELVGGALALDARPAELADALPQNPMLWRPSVYEGGRAELWRLYRARGYESMVRKLHYYPSALRVLAGKAKRKLKAGVKRVLGKA